jgi:hypothetical protein
MAHVPQQIAPNTRVTLAVGPQPDAQFMPEFGEHMIQGQVGVLCVLCVLCAEA